MAWPARCVSGRRHVSAGRILRCLHARGVWLRSPNARQPGARVANEIPTVGTYYANRAGRPDLISVELSDPAEIAKLRPGDFVIDARGRTYYSNQAMLKRLRQTSGRRLRYSVGERSGGECLCFGSEIARRRCAASSRVRSPTVREGNSGDHVFDSRARVNHN